MNKHTQSDKFNTVPVKDSSDYQYIPLDDWKNYFYSTDFDLSVTLICKGHPLVTIDAERGGKLLFVFNSSPELGAVVDGYWSNKITVSPLDFANARKNLKSRIFGMRKNYK
ncbi:DUF5659 domain-containing protein [Candidatus Nomurabacteria bacterium]|nr:DUF5659 domain-containing protein [Candidatus Nomurabacteria bacterium]